MRRGEEKVTGNLRQDSPELDNQPGNNAAQSDDPEDNQGYFHPSDGFFGIRRCAIDPLVPRPLLLTASSVIMTKIPPESVVFIDWRWVFHGEWVPNQVPDGHRDGKPDFTKNPSRARKKRPSAETEGRLKIRDSVAASRRITSRHALPEQALAPLGSPGIEEADEGRAALPHQCSSTRRPTEQKRKRQVRK